jgi:hypothetical protein
MRNLLHPNDRDRLLAFLSGRLAREVTLAGQRHAALAEGEGAEASQLCDLGGNARAAEWLAQPDIRDQQPGLADGVLDFVMAMADAPMPCGRAVLGGLEILREDPRAFEVLTPFHRFAGDLSAGLVLQWLRPRIGTLPGTALPPVIHSGNMVELRIGRHRSCIDAEDGITAFGLVRQGEGVMLWHEAPVTAKAGLLRARAVPAGTLRYEYAIAADSPVLRLTVSFRAARGVARLRLTTAADALGAMGLDLAVARLHQGGAWADQPAPAGKGLATWAEAAPVAHLALGREGWPATGPTLHLRPGAPAAVASVKAVAERAGALHWLLLRHAVPDLAAGATATVREDRLLAPGTTADAAAQAMVANGMEGLDRVPSAPSGAALAAVAAQLLLASAGAYRVPPPPDRLAALAAWFDRRLPALVAARPPVEEVALALLAAEQRLRAGPSAVARRGMAELAARLLAAQRPAGGFGEAGLPAHAAAMLALARGATQLPAAAPLLRALQALQPGEVGVTVAGEAPGDPAREAEGLGLLLRALGALHLAAEDGAVALPAEAQERVQALHRQVLGLIRPLVRPREGMLEVAAFDPGGSATPASQAAVALGLMAPETLTMRVPVPAG